LAKAIVAARTAGQQLSLRHDRAARNAETEVAQGEARLKATLADIRAATGKS
jgi:hypothetical protein